MTDGPRLERGDLGLLLLGALARREMYGYELAADLRARTDGTIDLPEGTIYPGLRRLEHQGLIDGHWVEVGSSPRRRYYRLTARGEAALSAGRQEWRRFATAADRLLG